MSTITADPIKLPPKSMVTVNFSVVLPPNSEINSEAPSDILVHDGENIIFSQKVTSPVTTFSIPSDSCASGTIYTDSSIFYCGIKDKVCKIKSFSFVQKCSVSQDGSGSISLTADIPKSL